MHLLLSHDEAHAEPAGPEGLAAGPEGQAAGPEGQAAGPEGLAAAPARGGGAWPQKSRMQFDWVKFQ